MFFPLKDGHSTEKLEALLQTHLVLLYTRWVVTDAFSDTC